MSEISELQKCLADLENAHRNTVELRRRRAELVQQLHSAGWTLQRIADSVGRTKQAVDQWRKA